MFSGIVECTSKAINVFSPSTEVVRVQVERPGTFNDIEIGDSIAVNGVCLTVEAFDEKSIQFAIGKETLNITGWSQEWLGHAILNLERSLSLGARIHGHLVSGHVDIQGKVSDLTSSEEGLELWVEFPKNFRAYFWPKGSVALNGVSLTINEVKENALRVNLIPETLRVTNLGELKAKDFINIEIDSFARGLIHYFKDKEPNGTSLR